MMGTTRRGKPGLKKHLLSRLRRVKEISRQELDTKPTGLSDHDCPSVTVDIPHPLPEGIPPPLPELPEPQPSDVHEVLRVSDSAAVLVKNQYGKT